MAIEMNGSRYEGFFEYLKSERPEFYSKLMRYYSEKIGVIPEMTKRQYLLLIAKNMGKRGETKLESLDSNLIDEDDVKNLEKMIKKSSRLKEVLQEYSDVQRVATYVSKKDKEKLEGEIVDKLHNNMDKKQKRQYNKKHISHILPKLNLGPWRRRGRSYKDIQNMEEIIAKRKDLFEKYEDIAIRILEAVHGQEIQSEKTFEDARRKLRE